MRANQGTFARVALKPERSEGFRGCISKVYIRRSISKGTVGPDLIIINAPQFNFSLGISHRQEPVFIEAFLPEPAVK